MKKQEFKELVTSVRQAGKIARKKMHASRTMSFKPVKPDPQMRAEYDLRGGVRGEYATRLARGTNIVILEPDVAERFPDSKSVNDALRALAAIADRKVRRSPDRRSMTKKGRRR